MSIDVYLTADVFRRFTIFDLLYRRKTWQSPAIFALILSVCALVCFIMNHVDGAVMLGSVLLCVGLGMPISYFVAFFTSLHKQVITLGLPKKVYALYLTPKANGIAIENDHEHADYAWKDVYHVYRNKTATYLFMAPTRAFILPHSCIEEGAEGLWQLIEKKVSVKKRTILN